MDLVRSLFSLANSVNHHVAAGLHSLAPSKSRHQTHLQPTGNLMLRESLIILCDILERVFEREEP